MEDNNLEFYGSIKLVTGEEIFGSIYVDESENPPEQLVITDPICLKMINAGGVDVGFKIEPWMKFTTEDIFVIKMTQVVTISEVTDSKILDTYQKYLNSSSFTTLRNKTLSDKSSSRSNPDITKDMGYVSSVESARELLEKIYDAEDSKEL
jgi:hypothetical protein